VVNGIQLEEDKTMETFISTMAYDDDFVSSCKTGWGCGYVHIPKDHPILVELEEGWGNYLSPKDCPEEITYTRWDEKSEYLVIGFDTAHSYNDSAIHNEIYVTAQANAIKELVDNYTAYDAHAHATKQIQLVAKKYSKYLLS
jgi:hypothetical protein